METRLAEILPQPSGGVALFTRSFCGHCGLLRRGFAWAITV
jgi:hypothetical protein